MKPLLLLLMLSTPALASISPYEQWVMENWLKTDSRGDLNCDDVCNLADLAIAMKRDVLQAHTWGRTREICMESLTVAIAEAVFEGKMDIAAAMAENLMRMKGEDGL